jgi:hypothetical protein
MDGHFDDHHSQDIEIYGSREERIRICRPFLPVNKET